MNLVSDVQGPFWQEMSYMPVSKVQMSEVKCPMTGCPKSPCPLTGYQSTGAISRIHAVCLERLFYVIKQQILHCWATLVKLHSLHVNSESATSIRKTYIAVISHVIAFCITVARFTAHVTAVYITIEHIITAPARASCAFHCPKGGQPFNTEWHW